MIRKILWIIIFVQALIATLGSLYFSNFGDPLQGLFSGTGFEPCNLCRWARILMYPLVYLSLYAIIKKDENLAGLIGSVGITGMVLTGYHYLIQRQQSLNVFACSAGNSCAQIGWHIGFITIPFLAFVAFTVISICSWWLVISKKQLINLVIQENFSSLNEKGK